jgi:hypothetical protein
VPGLVRASHQYLDLIPGTTTPTDIDANPSYQLYESALYLTPADQTRTLVSITFNDATSGTGVINIYAVDGTASPVPAPPSLLLLGSGVLGLLGYRGRRLFSR